MNRRSHDFFLGLLAAMPIFTMAADAKDIEHLEWSPIPGATHYVGTVTEDGYTYLINTTSTWILTEKGTVKRIDAWDANGSLRTGVPVQKDAISRPQTVQPPRAIEPSKNPTEVESDTLEPTQGSDQEQIPESTTTQDEIGSDSEAPSEETESEATSMEDSPSKENSNQHYVRADVGIGMGRQWLNSEAGISKFSGGSNIGGTILYGSLAKANSALWYEGEFSAHNFATETSKTGASSASKSEEKNTQLRVRVSAFYNFIQRVSSLPAGLALGGGLQYLKHPLLVISDDQTGAATMKTKSAPTLNLGVRYGKLLTSRNHFSAGADQTLFGFDKDVKGMSTSASMTWLHLITPHIYTNLGVVTGREKIHSSDECPTVTNCKEEGETKSDVVQIRMGLDVIF